MPEQQTQQTSYKIHLHIRPILGYTTTSKLMQGNPRSYLPPPLSSFSSLDAYLAMDFNPISTTFDISPDTLSERCIPQPWIRWGSPTLRARLSEIPRENLSFSLSNLNPFYNIYQSPSYLHFGFRCSHTN